MKLLKGQALGTAEKTEADLILHCIIVDGTANVSLLHLLGGSEYEDQGKKALDYIQNFWGKNADENKAEGWHEEYQQLANGQYTKDLTSTEFATIRTKMMDLRQRR